MIDRRSTVTGLGIIGLGALLAACSDDDDNGGRKSRSSSSVQPTTSTDPSIAGMFGEVTTCTLTREMTEGPYYFDVDSIRSDIRENRQGATLRLAIRLLDAENCAPISNAVVEIWHCDALGVYSGFEQQSRAAQPGQAVPVAWSVPPIGTPTDDKRYLRGAQVTNGDGIVEFTTIYPGWYVGRTVHIHSKVHIDNATVLTTQLFFDDAVSDQVFGADPYANHPGRDTTNATDGIFDPNSLLTTSTVDGGYLALINYSVDD